MNQKKWVIPYLKQYKKMFVLSIFFGSLTVLFGVALMFTSGYLISKAATKPESILMVYVPIVGVRTFGIGRAVLSYIERLLGHSFVLKILSVMRLRVYRMVEPKALVIQSIYRTGNILGLVTEDIEHLQDFYLRTLFPSIISLVVYTGVIISAGLFSIPFAICLAVLMGLLLFVAPMVSLIYNKLKNKEMKKLKSNLYQHMTDAIFGIHEWTFNNQYINFIDQFEQKEKSRFGLEKKKQFFSQLRDAFLQATIGIIVLVTIYWADSLSVSQQIAPTFIAAFVLAMLSVGESFLPISTAIGEATTYQESVLRLSDVEKMTVEKTEDIGGPPSFSTSRVEINLMNVSFYYSPNQILLNEVGLKIKQGEKIAILGRSGTGKTTLLNIIQGALTPTQGLVEINGYKAESLQSWIPSIFSVLNQRAYLFNTSVMNNIRLGNRQATDEEVFEVCRMVELDDMFRKLPNGYDTLMQEAGQRFSGGERQRIALARVLLQNTPVVILDEPTVGLDPLTEMKLLNTIFKTLKDKTIIWVTHHLTGIKMADRILFLDNGEIKLEGKHRELIESNSKYRHLYYLDHPLEKSN